MDIKSLIENIVRSIIEIKDESELLLKVEESTYQTDLTIKVNQSEVGKLVGRKGKTISALRDVLDLITTQSNDLIQYNIWIEENQRV